MTVSIEAVAAVAPPEPLARLGIAAPATHPTGAEPHAEAKHASAPPPAPPAPPVAAPESSTRLLVEAGRGAQPFVYKIVDRITGKVLSEIPPARAESLAAEPSYSAGAVVDESA